MHIRKRKEHAFYDSQRCLVPYRSGGGVKLEENYNCVVVRMICAAILEPGSRMLLGHEHLHVYGRINWGEFTNLVR